MVLYFDTHELFVRDREFADSLLEESGFEPLVPPATEMLIELVRGITYATRMLAVGRHRAGAAVVLTLKWDQRFESAFLQQSVCLSGERRGCTRKAPHFGGILRVAGD